MHGLAAPLGAKSRNGKGWKMLTLVEALNFRCLRYIHRPLQPFQVLVGPNGSGKTTFLEVMEFLGALVSDDLEHAIGARTSDPRDLIWCRTFGYFELAVEARFPSGFQEHLNTPGMDTIRYEIRIGISEKTHDVSILEERVLLGKAARPKERTLDLFPSPQVPPSTLITKKQKTARTTVRKAPGGNDNFYSEVYGESGKGWVPSVRLGPKRSALRNLPADERKFPVTIWLRNFLAEGVQKVMLNHLEMRKPSKPGQGLRFRADGSNLPWVIEDLASKHPDRFRDWIGHLRTAISDLESIRTVLREEDKHRYLVIGYQGGLEVPSWVVSDGTLRLLALTLPAYLPELTGVLLIEEPENGVHPRAVETALQSLSSVYGAQVLLATHSPVILSAIEPENVLCFAKDKHGATDIVPGNEHPALRDWKRETALGVLFASGVLG